MLFGCLLGCGRLNRWTLKKWQKNKQIHKFDIQIDIMCRCACAAYVTFFAIFSQHFWKFQFMDNIYAHDHNPSSVKRTISLWKLIRLFPFCNLYLGYWFRYITRSVTNKMCPLFTTAIGRWFASNNQTLLRSSSTIQSFAFKMGSNRWIPSSFRRIHSRITIQYH